MRKVLGCLFLLVLALMLTTACEGPTGPAGPAGPSGNADTNTVYLGNNAVICSHCHDGKITGWNTTAHHASYKSDDECSRCHNTGYDPNVNNGGYDENHSEALRNVQCEACHGPMGPNPALHSPNLQANLSGEACGSCHEVEYAEWRGAAHADSSATSADLIAEWGGSSCRGCHLIEGYLNTWDAADHPTPTFADGNAHAVTCGACHDAHDNHTAKMLRAQSTITLPNPTGATITGWGKGLTCGNCHRDRRSGSDITNHMNGGNTHFGPHGSTQANMLAGVGSYKIPGYDYADSVSQHMIDDLPDKCVDCHMAKSGTAPHYSNRGHSFMPSLAKCTQCHEEATNFDVDGVQTTVHQKLDSLEALILLNTELTTIEDVGDTSKSTTAERQAAWAWFFVSNDGSYGAHNVNYAMTLVDNSIDFLNADRVAAPGLTAIRSH
jgi:hypothetical protein